MSTYCEAVKALLDNQNSDMVAPLQESTVTTVEILGRGFELVTKKNGFKSKKNVTDKKVIIDNGKVILKGYEPQAIYFIEKVAPSNKAPTTFENSYVKSGNQRCDIGKKCSRKGSNVRKREKFEVFGLTKLFEEPHERKQLKGNVAFKSLIKELKETYDLIKTFRDKENEGYIRCVQNDEKKVELFRSMDKSEDIAFRVLIRILRDQHKLRRNKFIESKNTNGFRKRKKGVDIWDIMKDEFEKLKVSDDFNPTPKKTACKSNSIDTSGRSNKNKRHVNTRVVTLKNENPPNYVEKANATTDRSCKFVSNWDEMSHLTSENASSESDSGSFRYRPIRGTPRVKPYGIVRDLNYWQVPSNEKNTKLQPSEKNKRPLSPTVTYPDIKRRRKVPFDLLLGNPVHPYLGMTYEHPISLCSSDEEEEPDGLFDDLDFSDDSEEPRMLSNDFFASPRQIVLGSAENKATKYVNDWPEERLFPELDDDSTPREIIMSTSQNHDKELANVANVTNTNEVEDILNSTNQNILDISRATLGNLSAFFGISPDNAVATDPPSTENMQNVAKGTLSDLQNQGVELSPISHDISTIRTPKVTNTSPTDDVNKKLPALPTTPTDPVCTKVEGEGRKDPPLSPVSSIRAENKTPPPTTNPTKISPQIPTIHLTPKHPPMIPVIATAPKVPTNTKIAATSANLAPTSTKIAPAALAPVMTKTATKPPTIPTLSIPTAPAKKSTFPPTTGIPTNVPTSAPATSTATKPPTTGSQATSGIDPNMVNFFADMFKRQEQAMKDLETSFSSRMNDLENKMSVNQSQYLNTSTGQTASTSTIGNIFQNPTVAPVPVSTSNSFELDYDSDEDDVSRFQRQMLNQERMRCNLPIIPLNREKLAEKKKAQLTKRIIEAADRVKLRKLKLDPDPKNRRLKFMNFVEDVGNILKMFAQTKNILAVYPEIQEPLPKYEYAKEALFTLLHSFVDLDGKGVIEAANMDGIVALTLLQSYCARITPQDRINCQKAFEMMSQYPNESASKYIIRFRDTKLLAKSVGKKYEEGEVIDKFLNSMHMGMIKYAPLVLSYQNQRRNEELTTGYSFAKLTLTEIESALLSIDEHTSKRYQAHQVNTRYRQNRSVPKDIKCWECGGNHYRSNCPLLQKDSKSDTNSSKSDLNTKKSENGNVAKTVVLKANSARSEFGGMVHVRPKNKKVIAETSCDLINWVLDSGCTGHMTPYKTDFVADTLREDHRLVEVANGYEVQATLSGTIVMPIFNDYGEKIHLRLEKVLYVPELTRRLFSLISLVDQQHKVLMSDSRGVQIWFKGERFPITLPSLNSMLADEECDDPIKEE